MFRYKKLIILLFASTVVFGGLFYADNAHAACTFSGTPIWGKSPAVVALNENIAFSFAGNQECAGKSVTIEFYGRGGFDFRVITMAVYATSPGGDVSGNVSFRASDFAGRTGDQRVYFKARAEDGSSNELTSQNLTVKLS